MEARHRAIEAEVDKMLRAGIIDDSTSPWASPITAVPKPDGMLHFCNDFRRLNQISKFDACPLP